MHEIGTRLGLIDINHPRSNPHSTRALDPVQWERENTPVRSSSGPTKNITGNYFGDALYKLLGGETISRALDGDHRAQGQVIMGGLVGMAGGGARGGKIGLSTSSRSVQNRNGVVYLRTDVNGQLKPYAGQAKSLDRFLARQKEHARANPNSDFEFDIIDRASPDGPFPTDLDHAEQKLLNQLGGPTNKSNPNGGASNKKNVIKQN